MVHCLAPVVPEESGFIAHRVITDDERRIIHHVCRLNSPTHVEENMSDNQCGEGGSAGLKVRVCASKGICSNYPKGLSDTYWNKIVMRTLGAPLFSRQTTVLRFESHVLVILECKMSKQLDPDRPQYRRR